MKTLNVVLCSTFMLAAASGLAQAQNAAAHFELPNECRPETAMHGEGHSDMSASGGGSGSVTHSGTMNMDDMDPDAMTEAMRANMEKMMVTMPAMHEGMMNDNPDIAFACGMIAHHQGAIDMAEVQLEYGEDETLRDLARTIIEDQKREIDEMTQWLAENGN